MNRPGLRVLLLLMLTLAALSGVSSPVAAAGATLTVSTCTTASLTTAIANAASGDTIVFGCSGTISLSTAAAWKYFIDKDLTIDGSGQDVTLDAGLTAAMFFMAPDVTFTLRSLTFTQGLGQSGKFCDACERVDFGGVVTNQSGTLNISDSTFRFNLSSGLHGGGAILNGFGTLNVSNSTFSNNTAYDDGGAIQSLIGTLHVVDSTFSNNLVRGAGGGVNVEGGTATISGSTFNGNVANAFSGNGSGGGLANSGTTTIINSTFSGNTAEAGGAIANTETLSVMHSTLSGNSATYWGNGIVNGTRIEGSLAGRPTTTLSNTILANADVPSRGSDGNFNLGGNCSGPGAFVNAGGIANDDRTCVISLVTTASLKLAPLADNGGPTQTIALGAGSVAINGVTCLASATTDQRGYTRPATGLKTCDSGAYEAGAVSPIQTTTLSGVSGAGTYLGNATLTAKLAVSGAGVAGKSISFTLNSTSVGSATTGSDGVATLSGVSLSGINAGAYAGAIGASFAGDANYSGSSGGGTLTVAKVDQTLSFDLSGLPAKKYGDGAFDISGYASATSGLAVSFSSATPSVCAVAGSTVTLQTAGSCAINADQAGNGNYNAAPQTQQQYTVGTATATITLDTSTLNQTYNGSPRAVTASTTPGGLSFSLTYNSSASAPTNAATYIVAATITDPNYTGSTSGTLTIAKADQTITVVTAAPTSAAYGATFIVAATADSGLLVSYAGSGACANSGDTVSMTSGAGSCIVSFAQSGDTNHTAAPTLTESVTASKANQSIRFTSTAPASAVYGATYAPTAGGGGSSSPVTFDASGACAYDGGAGVVTMTALGTCNVTADQAGDANYTAAPQVVQTFSISPAPAVITLDASTLSQTYDGGPHAVSVTTTPDGVSHSVTYDAATTAPSAAGSYAVVATITDPHYIGSTSGMLTIAKADQSIRFDLGSLLPQTYGDPSFDLSSDASASSGLPVSFTSATPAVCTMVGSTVAIVTSGLCSITADQEGDANHSAAPPATQSFSIAKASLSIAANDATMIYGGTVSTFDATITGLVNGDTFTGLGGVCGAALNGAPVASDTPPGSYTGAITCSGVNAANYVVTYTAGTLTVVDDTAPAIVCGAADGAWHAANVTVACTASDAGSGLALLADASFTLATSVADGSETANASTGSRQVCDLAGNCATAGPVGSHHIDRKAPTINLTRPTNGATYERGSAVQVAYGCADGGSGVASCVGTVANSAALDTSTPGQHTFTVTSLDALGHAMSQTVTYTVRAPLYVASMQVYQTTCHGLVRGCLTVGVHIVSQGKTVLGAQVSIRVNAPSGATQTLIATSGGLGGYARFDIFPLLPGVYTVTVTNVSAPNMTYTPALNVVTSATCTVAAITRQ